MKSIISIEFASKALVYLFALNLIMHFLFLSGEITTPEIYIFNDDLFLANFIIVPFVIVISLLIIIFTLIKSDILEWNINDLILTLGFCLVSIIAVVATIYFITEFRILPVLFTTSAAVFCWQLAKYPSEKITQ
jgi:hypothetical protein